ncbi:uncharacterized protein LOC107981533 [Nasonia vitripennis]|uniref:Uncharacterized protein n=1 Tax=Nasonia vitripennis TaxID=7425 RepID=A0A7M7PZ68_NASVI|nr:uncharacterized protein LOC107981533 [Nasonia vitripennis]
MIHVQNLKKSTKFDNANATHEILIEITDFTNEKLQKIEYLAPVLVEKKNEAKLLYVEGGKKTTDNPAFNVNYGTEDCEISIFANYNVDDVGFITEGDLYNNNVPGSNVQRIEEIEMQNSDLNGNKSAKSSPAKCVPCAIEPVVDSEIRSMNDDNVHYSTEDCGISTFANYNVDDVRFLTDDDLYNNNVPGSNIQRIKETKMQNGDLISDKSANSSPAKCVPCNNEPVIDLEIRSMNDETKEKGTHINVEDSEGKNEFFS